ncbi:cortical protein marker for cell polarity-domain-containing protein [Dendryphion nanum]|uniref:Cortical protein marker for cell polarity-domain-containing protein n=1 Tax=Dendryphion nanum TaxID=256645 RepID=A0A9P9DRS7_9PLEO|nr:cortical protein marker for cell polarity-domain-containing protein [Dendryphion nanum]
MRDSFSSAPWSQAGKLALSFLYASSHLISKTAAFSFPQVPSPDLSLDGLGRVAFAGDFDSISLYQYQGQAEQSSTLNGAILSRFPNGVFASINETDADVKAMCAFQRNGRLEGVVFGGNFTSVGRQTHTPGGIALLNVTDGTVSPLNGLNGSVNSLYCDARRGQVYVGGSFTGGNASNAIIWRDSWTNMPFSGFNGPVHSIIEAPNGKIIFGGEFNGLGDNSSAPTKNDTQVLPIGSANLTAQTSSGRPGLTEPNNIVCKANAEAQGTGSTWLLADNTPGFWRADFGFGFQPTKLRLHNTNFEDRGAKTWRYTALPDGGIMNFSYVDPSSGQRSFCDARCPLPQGNLSAQDFTFVNNIGMNSFRIDISEWYGQGGGLNGIELFQNDIYAYAINDFNEPKCGGVTTGASSTPTGPWLISPSHNSNSQYLRATVQGDNIGPNSASIVFQPDLRQSGNYSVTIYTPGCIGDGTCGTRGRVDINATLSRSGSNKPPVTLFQTNDFDKYDEIHLGPVDATNGFRPSITLTPSPGQSGIVTVVAQRVRFKVLNASVGGLNGLFEYDPNKQEVETNFADSVVDSAGATLRPQDQAIISTLVRSGERTYVGGNFTSDNGRNNIFALDNNASGPTALAGDGLNRQVNTLYQQNNTLFVGGNFTNTAKNDGTGLNGVASYSNNQWRALGAGVSGVVTNIVPFTLNLTANTPETVLAISGFFTRVNGFGTNPALPVRNFAIWVPSRNNWLLNLNINTIAVQGSLTAFTEVPNAAPLFAGSISSQSSGASGAVALSSSNGLSLQSFPMQIQAQQQQSSNRKRALTDRQNFNTTGVVAAIFYKENNMNKTILAGHFAATGSDGQNITNVLVIDGNDSNKVSGFGDQMNSNSTYGALAVQPNNILFAGGSISGTINNNRVAGVVAYDLAANNFPNVQPPALQGRNVTVNTIAPRPKSQDVYVGGRFESAGSLSCPSVCVWNTERNQWTSPGGDLDGVVASMIWIADTKLLIAGNLTAGRNQTKIVLYDSTNGQFQEFANSRDLPGPVTSLSLGSADGTEIWASGRTSDGSAFLHRYDGSKWLPVNGLFGQGTEIRGLQVLSLAKPHGRSDLIGQNQDLLILGKINVTGFGTASGVLFNGTALIPLLLSSTAQNTAGSLSQVFVENPQNLFRSGRKNLALGFVVLIALAIALALTFLLVVAGIALEWFRKRSQGYVPAPTTYPDRTVNTSRVPPEQLFGTLSGNRPPAI